LCDILGYTDGHGPRHAKIYRDFRAEQARLQAERIAAFREFVSDVASGVYPEEGHLVRMAPEELDAFREELE
jgi:3-methyl-2-oxobutanoate hydroxymethyltransferase